MPAKKSKTDVFRAGAARVDVTPEAGTHLGGTVGTLRQAEILCDSLYARAIVMELNGRKLCYIQADLEIITRRWGDHIRQEVHQQCGIPPSDCMVAPPQIHSVPPLGNFILGDELPHVPPELEYLRGSQTPFCEFAAKKMIEAAVLAQQRLEPVTVGFGRALRDDLAFNRRGIRRDGTACMPFLFSSLQKPLGPTEILCMEGPMDPEVGVVSFKNQDDQIVACLLHYTCHPVNVFARTRNALSADWPGSWAEGVRRLAGKDCVPLIVNGCCGNINSWPPFVPDFIPDHRRMGRELTRTTRAILKTMKHRKIEALNGMSRSLALPLKTASAEDRKAAEALLVKHPQPLWQKQNPTQVDGEWMDAAMLISVEMDRERSPDFCYELQAFRIGPVSLIGLPGEPFAEGQLAIKQASPFALNLVAHCANSYAGYIAPRDAYARGGHEIRQKPAQWAKLAPGALERIVNETGIMLKELYS
ncbi:MAG: hypothetical protein PHW60_04480 [Kiritimatiellae bacterium]|nr:hypothetical protein [Kiritimatiellia bacterium]